MVVIVGDGVESGVGIAVGWRAEVGVAIGLGVGVFGCKDVGVGKDATVGVGVATPSLQAHKPVLFACACRSRSKYSRSLLWPASV